MSIIHSNGIIEDVEWVNELNRMPVMQVTLSYGGSMDGTSLTFVIEPLDDVPTNTIVKIKKYISGYSSNGKGKKLTLNTREEFINTAWVVKVIPLELVHFRAKHDTSDDSGTIFERAITVDIGSKLIARDRLYGWR